MDKIGSVVKYMRDNAVVGFKKDNVLSIMELMNYYYIRHIPILDEELNVYRILTDNDLLGYIYENPSIEALLMLIEDLPGQDVITTDGAEDITKAILTFGENDISCLPIVKNESISGIITIQDILKIDTIWEEIEDYELSTFEEVMGYPVDEKITVTTDFSLWQILDNLNGTPSHNMIIKGKKDELLGLTSSLDLISEIIEYNRSLKYLSKGISFEEFLFTTNLEPEVIPTPIQLRAPVSMNEIRKTMIDHKTTSIIIKSYDDPKILITERDIFRFIERQLRDKLSMMSDTSV